MTLDEAGIINAAELLPGDGVVEATIQDAVLEMIKAFGEDPQREGLRNTPERVAKMYQELLIGYREDPISLINDDMFDVRYDQMVLVRDIEFYSLCEHHMLPFIGRAHVAYMPNGYVVGLSKIPRIVDMFARRLQIQERMTRQIADFIQTAIKPAGVAVVIEGLHMCSMMRGVMKHNARLTTSAMIGMFRTNLATREEFLDNISRGSNRMIL
jgi:GTP cyclohydrolase I